ncbi:uncharacterized protein LOC114271680 [Camellia sinensis]|uniref:uncharacterized protein LOC114271680 n=1 Tax=Camellia sinensis TaxID=4442 RepID=UPI001036E95F|nr:uncharacterized protein LOC114271680 [Camellia sinensis]
MAMETQEAFQAILHPNFKYPKLMLWSCPMAGQLKLNTDGCSKGDPRQSGFGGLLRDEKGMANTHIETDSQLAMELIWDGAVANSSYRALIEDANFIIKRCQCTIATIPREANYTADALANLGVAQQEHFIFLEDPPVSISSLLVNDMIHVGSRRDSNIPRL